MARKTLLKNKALIIGCGRLGASIANKISKEGKNVLIIDRSESSFELLDDSFSGYKIVGDVTDTATLEEAYITSAKDVVIATGDDNVNLFLAYLSREIYDVPNIYVRLDDPDLAALLDGKRVNVILPFQLSLDKFSFMRGGK